MLYKKVNKLRTIIYAVVFSGCITPVFATLPNNSAESVPQVIASRIQLTNGSSRMMCAAKLRCSLSATSQFYQSRNYQPVWFNNGQLIADTEKVIDILRFSYRDGLNPEDYNAHLLRTMYVNISTQLASGQTVSPEVASDFDVTLSDAYLLYSRHMEFGRVDNFSAYPDWKINKRYANTVTLFSDAAHSGNLAKNLQNLTPTYPGYGKLKLQLAKYQQIAAHGGWQTIPGKGGIKKGSRGKQVSLLAERIAATENYSLPDGAVVFDDDLRDGVKQFQGENGLKANGVVDAATLAALNIPVEQRLKQIAINMDRMRWLPNDLGNPYLMVNIPNYSLIISKDGQTEMSMPVIVGGGGDNKTCVVNSQINMLELNPYWGIPYRIATKEYLRKIQESPNYLYEHNIRVYRQSDNQEVDPETINWHGVTATNFKYFLRQDPGKKNALGRVKFMFNNDCGIYLHDTSNPKLFAKYSRSLSHGCVRVSEPIALADYLIAGNPNWSSDRLESAISSGKHRWLKLDQPLPIHIVYWTTWVNNQDQLQFRKDIYKTESVNFPVFIPKAKESNPE